ncbi:TonB-dependent receptor [uncultured Tenacibaculum sp.]|uniref:TonB-dependent receptor n=1 Tax=uncultured Tenacibaculum sp. TaxID=174713 RepID=UPI002613754C|nr:TonB-dependent receptor [uncultured Tenacibaculum sp.]
MKNFKNLLLVSLLFVVTAVFGQGVTSSSASGKITDDAGEPLPGANVLLVHTPSGTKYGASTDFNGFFRISNMRTGGPYKLTVSFVGFQTIENSGIYLTLGQSKKLNLTLKEDSNQLEEVVINAQRDGLIDGNKTGSETTIGKREIATVASASRSVADFVRLTPQTQISEGDDGFSISISGQNNRYNSIYIDGAVNNDVFGLAGSGTNGGQTGVSPFSIDAIEQFQVNIAPFDVRQSGFTGGAINAITRSGTNKFEGSAYFFTRNEDLAGKTPVDLVGANGRQKLGEFTANTYGVRIGGPIIEDKLFFFVNYERQDDELPQPFAIESYDGNSTAADITRLRDHVLNTYNYDIGSFENALRTLKSDKITAKIDWNIDDRNKLLFKHTYVKAENLETRSSGARDLAFSNGSEFFISNTNSSSLEWNYQGDKIANSFLVGYTRVRDDRSPFGNPFPTVVIGDGINTFGFDGIQFGAERFSTANLLNTDMLTITNNFNIYYGRHTFTIGTHNEFADVKNLFFASNFGTYIYDSVDDFINNTNLVDFERNYSLVSNSVGDDSTGAAEFGTKQFGFYVQDEVDFSDNLKITAGLRFDIPVWEDGTVNNDFNTRTVALLEAAGKDLKGARVGRGINTQLYISPRLGFNWDVGGNSKTQIRGGMGIFVSRLPLVWPGGIYNNNGVTQGTLEGATGLTFNPDVNTQPIGVAPGSGFTGGNVDLITPDFQLPQVVKYNLAIDRKLPAGFSVSADFVYNDNLSALFYENLNIPDAVGNLVGADNRPFYNRRGSIDNTYGRIILASNTNVGSSWNSSFTARNTFKSTFIDVYSSATYSFGTSTSIFDGTSSQNSSQWRGIVTVNGKNANPQLGRSGFDQGHRVFANVSADFKWNENLKTTIGLFYNGQQGRPFSYVYGGRDLLNDDSRDNALIYVPANASEINLVDFVDNGNTVTAAEQWAALDAYIENDDYLRTRRGTYAERNADRARFSHVVDLKFLQDFTVNAFGQKHTLQLSADIFNFTNLLNKNWGKTYFASDVNLIEVAGGGGTANPEFNFDPNRTITIDQIDDRGIQSSRWQAQIGLRYIFN